MTLDVLLDTYNRVIPEIARIERGEKDDDDQFAKEAMAEASRQKLASIDLIDFPIPEE